MFKKKCFPKKIFKISILIFLTFICTFKIIDILIDESNFTNLYISISDSKLESELINKNDIIVYFYKNQCLPCNKFKDTLNKVIEDKNYTIYGIDIEENEKDVINISEKYAIEYTPTVVIYKDGKEEDRIEEMISYEKLVKFLKNKMDN